MNPSLPDQSSTNPQSVNSAPNTAAPAGAITPVLPPAGIDFLGRSTLPFQAVDYALRGYHLDATIASDKVVFAAAELSREGFALDTITGVDWLAQNQMEIVYDYFHPLTGLRVVIRSKVTRENPEFPTISTVYPGAAWHEREAHDFFGIRFSGHPNLVPFLLPEDATYHPLRKDFAS